jgi:hypothetical protein
MTTRGFDGEFRRFPRREEALGLLLHAFHLGFGMT